MAVRVSYPHEAIADTRKFPDHSLSQDKGMVYLGTHFKYDVYIQTRGFEAGNLYCVYGSEEHQYYSAVGYGLVRTNKPSQEVSCYYLAAACALLNHPQHIQSVLNAHRG